MTKRRALSAVTPEGTFRRNSTRAYTHVAVIATETEMGVAGRHGHLAFWSVSEAGALKLTRTFIGVNGYKLVGVYPVIDGGEV